MVVNRESLRRTDYRRILSFPTIDALHKAVSFYDAVAPTIPKGKQDRLPRELAQTGVCEFSNRSCALTAERGKDGSYYLEIARDAAGPGGSGM